MVGINALISPNTINAHVIQSMDIVAVSVMGGGEPTEPVDGFKYREKKEATRKQTVFG